MKRLFIACIIFCFFVTGTSIYAKSSSNKHLSSWNEKLQFQITSSLHSQDRLSSIEVTTTTQLEQASMSIEEEIRAFGQATVSVTNGVIANYRNDYYKRLLITQESLMDFDFHELDTEIETDIGEIDADIIKMLDKLLSE